MTASLPIFLLDGCDLEDLRFILRQLPGVLPNRQ